MKKLIIIIYLGLFILQIADCQNNTNEIDTDSEQFISPIPNEETGIFIIIILTFEHVMLLNSCRNFLSTYSRFLPDSFGENVVGAKIFRRMWAVPHSAIFWMVFPPFTFFKIFFKFPFIECNGMAPSDPTVLFLISHLPTSWLFQPLASFLAVWYFFPSVRIPQIAYTIFRIMPENDIRFVGWHSSRFVDHREPYMNPLA